MIEAANKRIAEIHAKKATEASKALKAIEKAQEKSEKKKAEAKEKERDAVAKVVSKHADKVIAWDDKEFIKQRYNLARILNLII